MGIERRKAPRYDVEIPVVCEIKDEKSTYSINNISTGGVFIVTPSPLSTGQIFSIDFELPDKSAHIKTGVRVAWLSKEGAYKGMGVEFIDLDDKSFDAILAYIEKILRIK